MKNLVFLLEEPSARDLLEGLLPRLLPDGIAVYYLVFQGKQDLEKQLTRKIRGWQLPGSAFVVLRDQDAADCREVKAQLVELVTKTGRSPVLVRIACRDLEAWVVGDWHAVAQAYGQPMLELQSRKEVFRQPDRLKRPVEELRKLVPEYQKRDGARRVGRLLEPERSLSHSFKVFCAGVKALVSRPAPSP